MQTGELHSVHVECCGLQLCSILSRQKHNLHGKAVQHNDGHNWPHLNGVMAIPLLHRFDFHTVFLAESCTALFLQHDMQQSCATFCQESCAEIQAV